jgi:hypothetical protein
MASFEELQARAKNKGMKVIRSPQYGYYLITDAGAYPGVDYAKVEAKSDLVYMIMASSKDDRVGKVDGHDYMSSPGRVFVYSKKDPRQAIWEDCSLESAVKNKAKWAKD